MPLAENRVWKNVSCHECAPASGAESEKCSLSRVCPASGAESGNIFLVESVPC